MANSKEVREWTAIGLSILALLLSGWAACDAHKAAQREAEVAGDDVKLESPVVNVWNPSQNRDIQYPTTAAQTPTSPTVIPLAAWSASPPDRRTLTVTVHNIGRQEAQLAQPGLVTRIDLSKLAAPGYQHVPGIVTIYEDPDGLHPKCNHGIGDPEAVCSSVLAPNSAVLMTIALPEAYLHRVLPSDGDGGIEFSLFVGGVEKTLKTKIVLPREALGG